MNLRQCLARMVLLPFATAYPTLLFRRPRTWDAINITCCGALTDPTAWDLEVPKGLDGQAHAKAAAVQAFIDAHPQDRPVFIRYVRYTYSYVILCAAFCQAQFGTPSL